MGKVRVKVKKVVEKLPKLSGEPILVRFEHGELKSGLDLNSQMAGCYFEGEVPSQSQNHIQRSGPQALKRKQVVVVQNDQMTYIGSSDNPLNSQAGDLRTFIAVRRKKKLSLFEASPMVVSPYLGGIAHLQVDVKKDAPKTAEERRAAAIDLVKAFGSKKKRLTLERIEKHKISSEHMTTSMNTATESAKISEEVLNSNDDSITSLVPPCNREASDVCDVYSLKDILTPTDMDELEGLATQWLFCSNDQIKAWRNDKTFSDYFFEMWNKLSPQKNNPHTKYLAKLVLYTELLICLLKLKSYDIRKKVPTFPQAFPSWLVEKALLNFTTVNATNIRCRSDACRDKTACYIMVLVVLANDFIFDVQLMSTSLQIHITKLQTLARAVGITLATNTSTKERRGVLKLPLPKPIEKRGRARKMR